MEVNLGYLPGLKSSTNPLSIGSTAPSAILTLSHLSFFNFFGFVSSVFGFSFSFLVFVFHFLVFVFQI